MIIIDRFEGNFAVLETDSGMISVERSLIPANAKEGDVLGMYYGSYYIDYNATQARREAAASRYNRLRGLSND